MKSIIIVSNKEESEIDKFGITVFTDFLGKLSIDGKEIIVINNSVAETNLDTAMAICNGIITPKILLFHGDFPGYNGIKNYVGTGIQREEAKADRAVYQNLLDATDKFSVFDNVWDYFSKKNDKETLERNKTDFLYHIYNGGKPSDFLSKMKISNIDTFKNLYEQFEQENCHYQKQLDLDDDESKGADQRQKLSLLRDALLANK